MGCTGLSNHGNGPSYPPCAEMDPDTDLDEYLQKQKGRRKRTGNRKPPDRQRNRKRKIGPVGVASILNGKEDLQLMKLMDVLGASIGSMEKRKIICKLLLMHLSRFQMIWTMQNRICSKSVGKR